MEEGHILGYQIINEGISPNHAKIEEFLDSKTPHNLKGVKEINGRLTTLGWFIAKLVEKALPFFQTLKGCINKNQFKWKPKEEKDLQHLKEALHHLPTSSFPPIAKTL